MTTLKPISQKLGFLFTIVIYNGFLATMAPADQIKAIDKVAFYVLLAVYALGQLTFRLHSDGVCAQASVDLEEHFQVYHGATQRWTSGSHGQTSEIKDGTQHSDTIDIAVITESPDLADPTLVHKKG